jgi:uncharacterized small protein (DUF1192 family)
LERREMSTNIDTSTFYSKLRKFRRTAGLTVLYSMLDSLKGPRVSPTEVREMVDTLLKDRSVSKQSITNVARRLEEVSLLDREDGYRVNYGYLLSVLLASMMELQDRIDVLEEELETLKAGSSQS